MSMQLDSVALDQLFREARTYFKWRAVPVPDELLHRIYDLARLGATSANCSPMRVLFLKSRGAKERLVPALIKDNVEKTLSAPVTAVIGYDLAFYDLLPRLFPHTDARSWFVGNDALIEATAFRNGTLQGAYLMLAARACGLDCGPISGFDNGKVDAEFFADGPVRSNFICNLGYGDPAPLFPRQPRLAFDEVCDIL